MDADASCCFCGSSEGIWMQCAIRSLVMANPSDFNKGLLWILFCFCKVLRVFHGILQVHVWEEFCKGTIEIQ